MHHPFFSFPIAVCKCVVCTCVYARLHVWVYICELTCVCRWGNKIEVDSVVLPPDSMRPALSGKPELANRASLAGQFALDSLISVFQGWNYSQGALFTRHLHGFQGSEPWSSCLHGKHLTTEPSSAQPLYHTFLSHFKAPAK